MNDENWMEYDKSTNSQLNSLSISKTMKFQAGKYKYTFNKLSAVSGY